jgi:hypothetical protein
MARLNTFRYLRKPACLVLLVSSLVLAASGSHAQNAAVEQQTQRLLDGLGLFALLEQAPPALQLGFDAETRFRNPAPAQLDNWRHALEPRLKPKQLQQDLVHYVAERYRADTFARVEQILQDPLTRRARYFDLAMTQPGVARNLTALRAQLHAEPSPERRSLLEDIDAAAATSLLAAVLQTGVTERVRLTAGAPASDTAQLQAEIGERQRFLAPLAADYALYAYRYLRDEELSAYRDLLRDAQLQWLLDVSRQGVIAVLQGDVRPPPDSPR